MENWARSARQSLSCSRWQRWFLMLCVVATINMVLAVAVWMTTPSGRGSAERVGVN